MIHPDEIGTFHQTHMEILPIYRQHTGGFLNFKLLFKLSGVVITKKHAQLRV
jgi:hypothetical protein